LSVISAFPGGLLTNSEAKKFMHKQLQKAINLARKTGDRLIVYDMQDDDSAFAVMSLDEYEKLTIKKSHVHGLTEDELIDKINRDISIWKSDQIFEMDSTKEDNFSTDFKHEIADFTGKFDDNYHFLGEDSGEKEERPIKKKKSNHWSIPSERKDNAEEVIDEDRQYLEEIKY
jgi:hypothetical protein